VIVDLAVTSAIVLKKVAVEVARRVALGGSPSQGSHRSGRAEFHHLMLSTT
jgi:hypothetical protein